MSRSTNVVLSAALLTAAAATCNAAIISTTGQATQIAAPPSATFGSIVGTPASVWDEQQGFVTAGLPVDLSVNPSSSTSPTTGVVSGLLDSHIIHWNDFSGIAISGTVTFNGPIAGVAYSDPFLNVSDPIAGAFGTVYPTGFPFRGINSTAANFSVVSILGNTLTFNLGLIPGVIDFDQIRVYTRVPTPGSLALLGAGGLIAGRRRRK